MKTIKRVEVGFVKVEFMPSENEMIDKVIYISDRFETASHKCLCGCKLLTVTPLRKGEWRYQIDKQDQISMQPSVGNFQYPCKSHYIITKGVANFV